MTPATKLTHCTTCRRWVPLTNGTWHRCAMRTVRRVLH